MAAMPTRNIFDDIPEQFADELSHELLKGSQFRVERIVSRGQHSPAGFWYDQQEHEWVLLLKGAARLLFEDGNRVVQMKQGDYLHIPAHCRHRVEWTDLEQETVWLAVFFDR